MTNFFKYILSSVFILIIFSGCTKEYESIEQVDENNINAYIQKNKLTDIQQYKNTGIRYQLLNQGTGLTLDFAKPVAAILTVKSIDGKFLAVDTMAFYNRYYGFLGYFQPYSNAVFASKELIPELIKSVLVKEGGAMRFIVPSKLAYGRNNISSLPGYPDMELAGNSSLDISIKLLKTDKLEQYADETILQYLQKNSLTGFTKTPSGVYYKIANPGTGSPITVDSTIIAEYNLRLLDGKVIETATTTNPYTSPLFRQINAWKEIVPLIKQGGSVRIITPYTQAYGNAEAVLVGKAPFLQMDFDLKVNDVTN